MRLRAEIITLFSLLSLLLVPASTSAELAEADSVALPCPLDPVSFCLKLVVDADGLYRVTPGDLQAAGWDLSTLDPATFNMTSQGQPVAIWVAGEADGQLDPEDYVEFYGQRFRGDQMQEKYTDDNVYWLAAGAAAGLRMQQVDATPRGAPFTPESFWTVHRAEEDHHWFTHHTLDWTTRNTWWWIRLWVNDQGKQDLPTTVLAPAAEVYSATLSIEVAPRTTSSSQLHHFQIYWNDPGNEPAGQPVADEVFQGHDVVKRQVQMPGSLLQEGVNTLSFWLLNDLKASGARPRPGTILDFGEDLFPVFSSPDTPLATYDEVYVDYYELGYRRRYRAHEDQLLFSADVSGPHTVRVDGFSGSDLQLFDVSDPFRPSLLSGYQVGFAGDGTRLLTAQIDSDPENRYLVLSEEVVRQPKEISAPHASTLRSPTNGADWIVISHPDFLEEAQRLAAFRAQHDGFRTKVVNVDETYDQFNDGIFHPEAIRKFIAFAVENWQPPAPQYVLLIGDGNWNFKSDGVEIYGEPDPNWMPPFLVWEDPWQGEVASDNAFVSLDPDSPLASLAIGRMPARSAEEAAVMVDKVIAYESQTKGLSPSWHQRALFVADDADYGGNFPAVLDLLIDQNLPRHIAPTRAYLGITHTDPASMTEAIIDNVNAGVFMMTYLGHGSINRWGAEQFWNTTVVKELSNGQQLPLVITLNCLDGYFIHGTPELQAIAEEMLRHPDGGSVAAWSPTGLGLTSIDRILYSELLRTVFVDGVHRLGPATMAAKAKYYATLNDNPPAYQTTLLHTLSVFGDPALNLPVQWQRFMPQVSGNTGN